MATSKTGSFWLTETVTLPNGSASGDRVMGTIDLGAYVDVGDQQACALEQVDFLWQAGTDFNSNVESFLLSNASLTQQLSDLNPGTVFVRADDVNLIASGTININQGDNMVDKAADFFPDTFGKLDESRIVVNDQLYLCVGVDGGTVGGQDLFLTCRIKMRIVKLTTKDWMAIAIQSVASDN